MATQPKIWWRSGHKERITKTDIGRGGAIQKEEEEELSSLMTTPPIDDEGGDNDGRMTTLDNIESQYNNEVSQLVHQEGVVEAALCSDITTGKTTTTTLPRGCSYNAGKTHCFTHGCDTKSMKV